MKKKVIVSTIFLELVIIGIFFATILHKKNPVIQNESIDLFRKDVLLQHASKDLRYYYEVRPNITVKNDLRSFGKEYRYSTIETFNNDTLHETKNISAEKPKDVFRIITLGDSFTFGLHLNTEDTYPSQLQNILNTKLRCSNISKFEVINLGVFGYDIQYSVERYKIRGQKYNSDLLLWFIIDDDMIRLDEVMFPKSHEYRQEMLKTGEYQKLEKRGIYSTDYHRARDAVVKELGEDTILQLQRNYLDTLHNYYTKKLVILAFPFMKQKYQSILTDFSHSRPNTFFYSKLVNIYDMHGFFPDYHPNEKGAKMIAEDMYKYIVQKNLIPCK